MIWSRRDWQEAHSHTASPFASPAFATDFIDRNTGGCVAKFEGVAVLEGEINIIEISQRVVWGKHFNLLRFHDLCA